MSFYWLSEDVMKINPLQQEMQQMASQVKNISTPETGQQIGEEFAKLLDNAINKVNSIQKESSELATRFDMGDRNVTLSDVMIARNKSSVAFEATLQTRNKLIEAYKELMNMPV